MGCNCGKAKRKFQTLIQQKVTPQPSPPMTRAERIRLRGIRIEARAQRIAARNNAILAAKKAEEDRRNIGN